MKDDGRRRRARLFAARLLAPAGALVAVGLVALAAACGGDSGPGLAVSGRLRAPSSSP